MHFFQKQKYDAAGVVGVSLQKSLIFLMIVSALSFFTGGGVWSIGTIAILFTGFWGAYKRRPCLLSFYFWFNIVFAILSVVILVSLILIAPTYTDSYDSSSSEFMSSSNSIESSSNSFSSSLSSSSDSHHATRPLPPYHPSKIYGAIASLVAVPAVPSDASASSSSFSSSASESSSSFSVSSFGSFSDSMDIAVESSGIIIAILIIASVLSILITFFKIYSLVLAFRMRTLLLTSCASSSAPSCKSACAKPKVNPTYPAYTAVNQEEVSIPIPSGKVMHEEASAAVPSAPQQQPVMMYVPYPYFNQQQQPNGMPMAMMNQYGQPVYYSYGPVSPFQGSQL